MPVEMNVIFFFSKNHGRKRLLTHRFYCQPVQRPGERDTGTVSPWTLPDSQTTDLVPQSFEGTFFWSIIYKIPNVRHSRDNVDKLRRHIRCSIIYSFARTVTRFF